jgi:hypothetical protein
MEQQLAGETDIFWETLPQCYYVYHESHLDWLGSTRRIDDKNELFCLTNNYNISSVTRADHIYEINFPLIQSVDLQPDDFYWIWCKKGLRPCVKQRRSHFVA